MGRRPAEALLPRRSARRPGRRSSAATAPRSRPPTATTCWRARRSPTCSGSRRSTGEDALDLSLYRPLEARARACCAASSTGAASACRCPTCCRCSSRSGLTVTDERPVPRDAARRRRRRGSTTSGCRRTAPVDADAIRERFHEGFARVWHGEAEQDGFNGLIIAAGLDWREVTMLRVGRALPAPGRDPVQRPLHGGDAARRTRTSRRRWWSCSTRASTRPATARRRGRGARREIEAGDRRRRLARRGPDPARVPERRAGDAAHELLPARPEAVPVVQARPDAGPADAAAAAAVRDLRALAAGRGRAPARRVGRARRPALVGPARGLPHRDPRPDEGADGQERA